MGLFLLYIILMIGFLILLFRFILLYTNKMVGLFVESKHRDTEYILNSRFAPLEWKKRLPVRLGAGTAKLYAMRRVGKLISYIKHTPLVDSEAARKVTIDNLRSVRSEWRAKSWGEIYPYK